MIQRHAFQRSRDRSGASFLPERLAGAMDYDRIAGYFDSSLLEMAGEALEGLSGKIRMICNSDLNAQDVAIAEQAQKLSFFKNDPAELARGGKDRLQRLWRLLTGSDGPKLDVRVLPNEAFGLIHGKAGVIRYPDGRRTSFLGSANETFSGWNLNYELVWEDDSHEACDWVQKQFDELWAHPLALPLAQAVIKEVERLVSRTEVDIESWKKEASAASLAVESPVYRREFGLWPHQKYFVQTAWKAHRAYGARFILADQVGLGKTVQLGMAAQLMSLADGKPVLALLPKTLMQQWQTELWDLLELPSARWTGKQWVDEQGFEHPPAGRNPLMECPRRIGLVSQGLVVHGSALVNELLEKEWSCVIVDEAHRARRSSLPKQDERGPRLRDPEKEANRLYSFLYRLAPRTRSFLMGTATPIQMHPIEAWDLLRLLCEGDAHVLGDAASLWRRPEDCLPYILGEAAAPEDAGELWSWLRNPFPPEWEDDAFRKLRNDLGMTSGMAIAKPSFVELRPAQKVHATAGALSLFDKHNPFLRCIIRRTREYLEKTINPATKEPYLRPVAVVLYGEDEPVRLESYARQAYEAAEEFCRLLHKRVRSAGFFKTLLLRRIGSSLHAGLSTVTKMLNDWGSASNGEDEDDELIEDDGGLDGDGASFSASSELKNLSHEERLKLSECAQALEEGLREGPSSDPKWAMIRRYLQDELWAEDGCLLFSQYFDTAKWVAERIREAFPAEAVGLYAGSGKSGIYENGTFLKRDREEIKGLVKSGRIRILVGTDAASEGLNMQRLGTLINVDLPWNPTRLEQRKGRIQRIGQARSSVRILNLRYAPSVEDKVHEALSGRLEEIRKMFGQIPDVLSDAWVDVALGNLEQAKKRLGSLPPRHAFDERYSRVEDQEGWDECEKVVNRIEKLEELKKGWKG